MKCRIEVTLGTCHAGQAERIIRDQTIRPSRRRRYPSTSDSSEDSDPLRPVVASPFDLLSGIRTSKTVKVNLPTPKVFKGGVAEIIPLHYADLDDYVAYIGKTAQRAGTPLMDIVSLAFEGLAGKCAQQFAKSLPPAQVNDARSNKDV